MNERFVPFGARLVFGAVLVGLGVVWTLDNLGLADAGELLRWWPVLVIAYGVGKLGGVGFARRRVVGAIVTLLGALLLAHSLGYTTVGLGILWPLGLIALGAQILRRGGAPLPPRDTVEDTGNRIRSFALMGGASTRSVSQALRSAELTALMGGVELDLRAAKAADGRVVADVFAFLGGVEIILPPSWGLELEATPIMGAIQDERVVSSDLERTAVLVLRGGVLLGGLVLRSSPAERPVVRVGVVTRRGRRVNVGLGHIDIEPDDPPAGSRAPGSPPPPGETR